MDQQRIPKVALKRTPLEGANLGDQRPPGGNNHIELSKVNLSWGEAQRLARNRREWKQLILALCPPGTKRNKDKEGKYERMLITLKS